MVVADVPLRDWDSRENEEIVSRTARPLAIRRAETDVLVLRVGCGR